MLCESKSSRDRRHDLHLVLSDINWKFLEQGNYLVCDDETAGITPAILGRDVFVANNVHLLHKPHPVIRLGGHNVPLLLDKYLI